MRPSFSMSGVVDLSALKQPARPDGAAGAGGADGGGDAAAGSGAGFVIEASESDFQTVVLERSLRVPVVVIFSAARSEQCQQFDAVLAGLAKQFAGDFVLARIEAEANARLVQAMRVPGVPTVLAVVGGELIGQFSGILPEAEARQWITELLALAQREFGMAPGRGAQAPDDAAAEPPMDPALAAAYTALEADDLDGAAQALRNVLTQDPNHIEAKPMLAQVELMRRTRDTDPAAALALHQRDPEDVAARCVAADALLAAGQVDEAFALLLDGVRDHAGEDRDRIRKLLVEYFELIGPQDPRVGKARARLTSLLF